MSAVPRQRAAGLAMSALVVASLAACVSESDLDGSAQAQSSTDRSELQCGAATGEPATGDPIVVRAVATASGGIDFSSSPVAAQAYFDCVNENGGINGRPIDYAYEDDALDHSAMQEIDKITRPHTSCISGEDARCPGIDGVRAAVGRLYVLLPGLGRGSLEWVPPGGGSVRAADAR